jgi:hypothetical protein
LFFKVLLQKGLISEEIKYTTNNVVYCGLSFGYRDYVIVGFDDTTVRIYVEYLSKLTIAPNDKKYLKGKHVILTVCINDLIRCNKSCIILS